MFLSLSVKRINRWAHSVPSWSFSITSEIQSHSAHTFEHTALIVRMKTKKLVIRSDWSYSNAHTYKRAKRITEIKTNQVNVQLCL